MKRIIEAAFDRTLAFLTEELSVMPLDRWNESVFRYVYCRCLAEMNPEFEQFVECDRIDLVLANRNSRAFIEFKFFRRPRRFDPYDGTLRGFKGGAGKQNLAEFQDCVDELSGRRPIEGLSKYIVLAFADPTDMSPKSYRYASYYDDYEDHRVRRLKAAGPIDASGEVLKAQLLAID